MAVSSTQAPKLSKARKLGKNKKKAWRAADVDDIKEFLEDEQRQVIAGGIVSEKTDDTLFVLDTAASKKEEHLDSKKQKKAKSRKKALKCLSLLLPDPNSKPVRTPDAEIFKKGKKSQLKVERLMSKVQVVGKQRRLEEQKSREERRAKKRKLPFLGFDVEEDIWAEPPDEKTHVTVKPPKMFRKKRSAHPATAVPHPGSSVNPAFDDHQNLLLQAREVEVKKYIAEKKIYNALDAKFPSKADAPTQADYLVEMSAGLVPSSDEEDSDAEGDDVAIASNPPVRREDRKTKQQRRKELEAKIQEKDKKSHKAASQRENMVLRIPTLKTEIKKQEKVYSERAKKRAFERSQRKFKTKRLGKEKYVEPDLDLKLSEELVGSLREIKPEGHIIKDVYKSLQKRNIIEPRIRQKNKRTYKPKVYEKKTHKEVTL